MEHVGVLVREWVRGLGTRMGPRSGYENASGKAILPSKSEAKNGGHGGLFGRQI